MKVRFCMKDPDGVDYAAQDICRQIPGDAGAEVSEDFLALFRYEEYLDLEYDTETKTLTVLPKH